MAGGPREQIAAGAEASLLIKPFKATDQSNPGLLQQVVELFRPALLLATTAQWARPRCLRAC